VIVPGLDNAQSAFPEIAMRVLPPSLTGLVLAGALSDLMSTADGPILASSTLVFRDLWITHDMQQTGAYRWVTLAVGVFATVSAVWMEDVGVVLNVVDFRGGPSRVL
jgi:Na+/pantothenate symporter